MITAGLTGGVASGKTTVSQAFLKQGIPIVNADVVTNAALMPGTPGWKSIVKTFGVQFLTSESTIDDAKLGKAIFANAEMLRKFNELMRPIVQEETARAIKTLQDKGSELVIYEGTLIIEGGLADKYRPLILVDCTIEQQLERIIKRGTGHGPISKREAFELIKFQMPSKRRIAMADYIIDTSKSIEESISQAVDVIEKMLTRKSG
jgi:dephospho-CoA kinase